MKRLALSLLLWLAAALPAHAVCLSPLCTCSVSAGTLNFGSHNPLSGQPTDSSSTLTVACGGVAGLLIPYQLELGPGGSGNVLARRLASGGHTLPYGLYTDTARSTPWGNGSGGTILIGSFLLDALGLAPAQQRTVYGRIPAGPLNAVPGVYTDTITVTLTYF
jgi:spore coat protein U-like protein